MKYFTRLQSKMIFLSTLLGGLGATTSQPVRAAVSDGRPKIVFTANRDGNREIYIIDQDGTHEKRLTSNAADDFMPCISPDGNKVLWSSNRGGGGHKIYEMNIDGTSPVRLTDGGSDDLQAAYSPDGTKIAFSTNRFGGDYDVALMNRNGTGISRLTFNQFGDYNATFSPDGQQIAFLTFYGNTYIPQITKINTDGTGQTQLTSLGQNSNPAWGSNGKIAFASDRDGNLEIYSMLPDGSEQNNLTRNSSLDADVSWSPDGSQLAFASNRSGQSQIYISNAAGGGITQVTTTAGGNEDPSYGPASFSPLASVVKIADTAVTEGNSGQRSAQFKVTLNRASESAVTVDYATDPSNAENTATAGTDYLETSGIVTFAAGETSKTISVPVPGDTLNEANEIFVVKLSNPVGAAIGDAQAKCTIVDDDPTPSLTVTNRTVTEGNSGTTDMVFTAKLSHASGRTVSAGYRILNGTTDSADFVDGTTSGTVTIPAGETSTDITISVKGDIGFENDESFTVQLYTSANAVIVSVPVFDPANKHYYELVEDHTVNWAAAKEAAELKTMGAVRGHLVTVTSAAEQAFVARLSDVGFHMGGYQPAGRAEPGGDWKWVTGEPFTYTNWNGGEPNNAGNGEEEDILNSTTAGRWNDATSSYLPGWYLVEYDTTAEQSGLPDAGGHGIILNDDARPSITVANAAPVTEGDTGNQTVSFNVTLSAPSATATTVKVQTLDITATAGADYEKLAPAILTFAPGEVSKTVAVKVLGDVLDEDDETFYLDLSAPVNATLANAHGIGTILDDDATPSISISDLVVPEGASGVTPAKFTVTLSASSGRPVKFDFATLDGSAHAGQDYTALSETETIEEGQTSKDITVSVTGDDQAEDNESFYGVLSNPVNATITKSLGTAIISDDDSPHISIADVSQPEGNDGNNNFIFNVSLDHATNRTVTVHFGTADGTAKAGEDYTATSGDVTFNPGDTVRPIEVPVVGDKVEEPLEIFVVSLSGAENAILSDSQATGTIRNDDDDPDVTPPFAPVITYPTPGSVVRTLGQIRGTATDNPATEKLDRVELTLQRTGDGKYWDGSAWSGRTPVPLSTDLDGENWVRSSGLPDLSNADSMTRYTVIVTSYDFGLNKASSGGQFRVDSAGPAVSVMAPAAGSAAPSLTTINGTVSDNLLGSGVQRVDAYLRRAADGGGVEYWGDRQGNWGWGSDRVFIPTVVKGTSFNVVNDVPSGTVLPSGDDLPDGIYTAGAYAYDNLGNRTESTSNAFVIDSHAPTSIAVKTPANGSALRSVTLIDGTIVDAPGGSGLARVDVYLRHEIAGSAAQYWGFRDNAWGWSNTPSLLPTVLAGSNWSLRANAPTGFIIPAGEDLPDGLYSVEAQGYDKAHNRAVSAKSYFTIDTGTASIAITSPVNGSTVQTLSSIAGTVADNAGGSGIDKATAYLRRARITGGFEYWGSRDGTYGWGPNVIYLPASVAGGKWSIMPDAPQGTQLPSDSDLMDGSYQIAAYAYDRAGNSAALAQSAFVVSNSPSAPRATDTPAASNVLLSSASANAAHNSVTLTFAGVLSPDSAVQATNYNVRIAGEDVAVESASQARGNEITLNLPEGALHAGDSIDVTYNLRDAHANTLEGAVMVKAK